MRLIYFYLLLFLAVSQFAFSQHTDIINSNRPGESMSAFAVGNRVFQVESGLNFTAQNHRILDYSSKGYFVDLNLRYGMITEE